MCAGDDGAGLGTAPAVLVAVCPRMDQVPGMIGDLSLFSPRVPVRFPVHESLSAERMVQDDALAIACAC